VDGTENFMTKPKAKNRKRAAAVAGAAPCSAKLWAWWDAKAKTYKFVYPSRLCVIICSADGFKRATRDGEGKVVRVTVSPNAAR